MKKYIIIIFITLIALGFILFSWFVPIISQTEQLEVFSPEGNFMTDIETKVTILEWLRGVNSTLKENKYILQNEINQENENFVDDYSNEEAKSDLIILKSPLPGETVSSPLKITGEARGYWFFEANFPIYITNWDGLIIGEGYATAKKEWMTENFVPFEATIEFYLVESYSNRGTLILQKSNPSGLTEHDDALEIPVFIEN